jgi:hypothetical protein
VERVFSLGLKSLRRAKCIVLLVPQLIQSWSMTSLEAARWLSCVKQYQQQRRQWLLPHLRKRAGSHHNCRRVAHRSLREKLASQGNCTDACGSVSRSWPSQRSNGRFCLASRALRSRIGPVRNPLGQGLRAWTLLVQQLQAGQPFGSTHVAKIVVVPPSCLFVCLLMFRVK